MYPQSFKKLIDNFSSLPSVGPKMAERLVLFLFKQDKEKLELFAQNLEDLKNLKSCQKCFNISEDGLCEICKNSSREQKTICVVEEPLDIISIEKTRIYKGLYHVLGGVIFGGAETKDLKISELLARIKKENTEEIILATNPTTEGDATALYLKRQIKDFHPHTNSENSSTTGKNNTTEQSIAGIGVGVNIPVKISRLAKGLATGGDIEYADEATLSAALTNRRELV